MRFYLKPSPEPKIGDIKTKYIFLNLPRKFGDYIYWLEYIRCTYEYRKCVSSFGIIRTSYINKWVLTHEIVRER